MTRGGRSKLTSSQEDEIVRRYTTRLPDGTWEGTTSIGKSFEISASRVRHLLCVCGVSIRTRKESHAGKACRPVKNLPRGDAPMCKCDCGWQVGWNRRRNRWNAYVTGHYRKDKPYKNEEWLREEYVGKGRGLKDIAREQNVNISTISAFVDKFEIPRQPVNHKLKGSPGVRNGAWRGGVAAWPYSSDWKSLARQIRDRDKWTCQDCGECRKYWGVNLHVHHIDGDKTNNDPSNLISLCSACHRHRHVLMAK
jgi:hypothetical protein